MTPEGPIAVLSALAEEQQGLLECMDHVQRVDYAGRVFWFGMVHGLPVVLALSRIGKVAAASTVTALIARFGVAKVVFTGVAGGIGAGVQVGDVVVGSHYLQHDMDASPLFPRYEVPLGGRTLYEADAALLGIACKSVRRMQPALRQGAFQAVLHQGLIVSGDRFVSGAAEVRRLSADLTEAGHHPLAVEMEGAAVAQVCTDFGVPFVAMRTISDRADDSAHVDFSHFVRETASVYARLFILNMLEALSTE